MSWSEVFIALLICHLAGDFLLQTDWQAQHKRGGLGRDAIARRALASHILTYGLCFIPAAVWVGIESGVGLAVALMAFVVVPHWIQDDGRLVTRFAERVKGYTAGPGGLMVAVDQSFHAVALFGTALLVGALS